MNEIATKLDLARAYVDMGEPDGAYEILEEVLEHGDKSQKQLAKKLIKTLNR
jgi:pilus assembly protein FimV